MSESTPEIQKTDIFTDLVIALLSVNNWPLEKVANILPGLQRERLTAYAEVSQMEWGEVCSRLKAGGYARSEYVVSLLTDRILSVAKAFKEKQLEQKVICFELGKKREAIQECLLELYGVGPRVVENFLLLRGL